MVDRRPVRRGWRRLDLHGSHTSERECPDNQSIWRNVTTQSTSAPMHAQEYLLSGQGQEQGAQEQRRSASPIRTKRWADLFMKNRVCSEDTTLKCLSKQKDRIKLDAEDKESMEDTVAFCLLGWPILR